MITTEVETRCHDPVEISFQYEDFDLDALITIDAITRTDSENLLAYEGTAVLGPGDNFYRISYIYNIVPSDPGLAILNDRLFVPGLYQIGRYLQLIQPQVLHYTQIGYGVWN